MAYFVSFNMLSQIIVFAFFQTCKIFFPTNQANTIKVQVKSFKMSGRLSKLVQ